MRPIVASCACALACVLLFAAAPRAQDDGGEDPFSGNGPGVPGTNGQDDNGILKPKKRGWTSQQLLKWEFDAGYAPSKPGAPPLPVKDALVALAGHDPRPLLVMRECNGCDRDDHKLMEKAQADDRTIVYARWYHSVRVSADVLKPDHPFHALFEGKTPPHMLVATLDGSLVTEIGARANLAQLCKNLAGVLRKAYKKDPDAAAKAMLALLDEFDRCDIGLSDTEDQLIQVTKAKGAESKDAKKLADQKKLLTDERTAALAKGKLLDDLGLKTAEPAAAPGG